MNSFYKKFVFIGLDVAAYERYANLVAQKVNAEEILLITNQRELVNYDIIENVQTALYVLQPVIVNTFVCGLICVDKLSGEIVFIQSDTIFIKQESVEMYVENTREISFLYANIPYLSTLGIDKSGITSIEPGKVENIRQKKTVEVSQSEFQLLAENEMLGIRILPDLDTLLKLREEVEAVLKKFVLIEGTRDTHKAHKLLNVVIDGLERFAIESYHERTNIYELILTREIEMLAQAGIARVEKDKTMCCPK